MYNYILAVLLTLYGTLVCILVAVLVEMCSTLHDIVYSMLYMQWVTNKPLGECYTEKLHNFCYGCTLIHRLNGYEPHMHLH